MEGKTTSAYGFPAIHMHAMTTWTKQKGAWMIRRSEEKRRTVFRGTSSWTAHPNRKHHRGDRDITPNTSSQRPPCWQGVQSETMPPAMRFSTGHSVSQSLLFLWCVHSYGLWRRKPDTKPKLRKQPNIRHLNPRQTMPAYTHPVNCIMTRS